MYIRAYFRTIYSISLVCISVFMLLPHHWDYWSSEVALVVVVMNLPASAGSVRDTSSIPGSGRSPGGQHGNPLQYSCLESPYGQRNLAATVRRVIKSLTWLAATAVVSFKIRNYETATFVLYQDYPGFLGALKIPHEF